MLLGNANLVGFYANEAAGKSEQRQSIQMNMQSMKEWMRW